MSDEDFDLLVTRSSIFKQYLAEKASIARHQKRIETREQRSINFETAMVDWMLRRRRSWLRERRDA